MQFRHPLLQKGDCVGLIACSDGIRPENAEQVDNLTAMLSQFDLQIEQAATLFRCEGPFSGTPAERADALLSLFCNPKVKVIFDISGGDTANQVLPYLDFGGIASHPKPFAGISDLTVVLNALYAKTNMPTFHYQLLHLCGNASAQQVTVFDDLFRTPGPHTPGFDQTWLRGQHINGIVIGGNIRCLLKLAGTTYLPDPHGKILFLESLGGGPNRMAALLAQLDQIGYLQQCAGIILGTFTQMEAQQLQPTIETLVLEITQPYQMPVVKTSQLGHGDDAVWLSIGAEITLDAASNPCAD